VESEFLKTVQKAGWQIERVSETDVTGKCPSIGCEMRAKLKPDAMVPQVASSCRSSPIDLPVEDFDGLRRLLRSRREALALTIREVEEIAGITVDYLAKFEKNDPSKIPNMQTALDWIQSLGYEVVIRPAEMTPYALRVICETRPKYESRKRRFEIENARRG
jgi:transcriptional regulator with XRE-family HTH domain